MQFSIISHWFDLGIIRSLILATFDNISVEHNTVVRMSILFVFFFLVNEGTVDPSKAKLSNFKFTTGEQLRYVLL